MPVWINFKSFARGKRDQDQRHREWPFPKASLQLAFASALLTRRMAGQLMELLTTVRMAKPKATFKVIWDITDTLMAVSWDGKWKLEWQHSRACRRPPKGDSCAG